MSADIIQFIPRPKHGREPTDFPTIAFRSVVPYDSAKINGAKINGAKATGTKANGAVLNGATNGLAKGPAPKPCPVRGDPVVDHLDTAPSEYVPSDWSEK